MNLETKITIYKFTPQVFTLTPFLAFYSNSGRRIEYVSMKKENLFTTISILHW